MAGGKCEYLTAARDRRVQQIEFLIENMTEPSFVNLEATNTSLSIAFGMENTISFNPTAITYRLLNNREIDDNKTYSGVASFMNSIQDYLPENLRSNRRLWIPSSFGTAEKPNMSKKMLDAIELFLEWFRVMKQKIEDRLTNQFYMAGDKKSQYLDILKRRFKHNWCDKIEQQVEARVDAEVDQTINIIVEDY